MTEFTDEQREALRQQSEVIHSTALDNVCTEHNRTAVEVRYQAVGKVLRKNRPLA